MGFCVGILDLSDVVTPRTPETEIFLNEVVFLEKSKLWTAVTGKEGGEDLSVVVVFVLVAFLCSCEVWLSSEISKVFSGEVVYLTSDAMYEVLFICGNGLVVPIVFTILIFGVSLVLCEAWVTAVVNKDLCVSMVVGTEAEAI